MEADFCKELYRGFAFIQSLIYCNTTFDGFLCWPPTIAGEIIFQNCPAARHSDTRRHAVRHCGYDGIWIGKENNESETLGWTNYTSCFPREVQKLLVRVNNDANSQEKIDIAHYTSYLEMVGFTSSLLALLISLFIFIYFKSLRNTRTIIHLNLFAAMTIQVFIRLILYVDQAIIRDQPDINYKGLDGMPFLCQTSYVLLEYAISAMFMWMFIEGLFLHSVVTANALRENSTSRLFPAIGWGLPVIVTAAWTIVTFLHYQKEVGCWYGYNFLPDYWVLQGPRLGVILINFIFLLKIMKVLITKLNATENNERTKLKKAARAALVLLPLLGITNILNMIEPVTEAVWKFAIWCYFTHFLRSFQGFFISVIYCFSNGEVNDVLNKAVRDRIERKRDEERRRAATLQQARRPKWWFIACFEAFLTTLRAARKWLGDQFCEPNAVDDVEIALETLSEAVQRRNYADPYYQDGMEELRYVNEHVVVAKND